MMIIDAHQHLSLGFENTQPLIDSGVVDQVWLFSTPPDKRLCGDREVLEVYRKFPDFFVPFGFLDFTKSVDAIDEIKAKGFVGAKTIWPPKPYGDESLFPYYERLEQLKMPLVIHAAGAMYWPQENVNIEKRLTGGKFMHVYHLDIIAKMFPELTIIGAHLGAPWYDEAINVANAHKNVYFDISDGHLVRNIHKVKEALAIPGFDEKLLFGTDTTPEHVGWCTRLTYFWEVFFSENVTLEVKEKIMGGNAKKVISKLR